MEFLPIIALLAVSLLALFVIGAVMEPRAARAVTPRAVWATVRRGNAMLAPTTPYQQFARRS